MFCPECGAEFREGVSRCGDCDVDLVAEPPPTSDAQPEWCDMVTVAQSSDTAYLLVAKSVLDQADIRYFAKNEGVQDLFAFGRLGTGFNVLAGPVEIQVAKDDEAVARALLEEIVPEDETSDA